MRHTKLITWQELSETFSIADGKLYRKLKSGRIKLINRKPNKKGVSTVKLGRVNWNYNRVAYMLLNQVTLTSTQLIVERGNGIDNLIIISNSDNLKGKLK